jgi:hypothetical protein
VSYFDGEELRDAAQHLLGIYVRAQDAPKLRERHQVLEGGSAPAAFRARHAKGTARAIDVPLARVARRRFASSQGTGIMRGDLCREVGGGLEMASASTVMR